VLLVADRVTPESARAALAAGASGCLRRGGPLTELLAAIRTVLGGGTYVSAEMLAGGRAIVSPPSEEPLAGLSRRQQEILRLLVAGLNPKAIAARIGISHRTVEFHKYQAMTRLGCKTFPEMIRLAVENGIKPG
jgi:DNA-binding NarL/FixJ family response regulator